MPRYISLPFWGRQIAEGETDEVPSDFASRLCCVKGATASDKDLIRHLLAQMPPFPEGKAFGARRLYSPFFAFIRANTAVGRP